MKTQTVATLKKKADKVFSLYIRTRDSKDELAECITCRTRKPIKEMQAGHFVSRRVNSLRFDEQNVNAQCYACNVMKHGDIYNYAKQLDLKYGDRTAERLHNRRFETHKFTVGELEEIITTYKEK